MSNRDLTRRAVIKTGAVALTATALWTPKARATTELNLWTFIDPRDTSVRSKVLAHVLSSFESQNPGLSVKPFVLQWDQISSTFLRADQAGNVPDLVMIYSPNLGVHISAGTIVPLDGWIGQQPAADREDQIVLPVAKRGGKTYGLPWELRVYGIAYNKKEMRAAKVEEPTNLIGLAAAAGKMAETGHVGISVGLSPADPSTALLSSISMLGGLGGKILNEDGTAAFASKQWEDVAGYFHDLVYKYKALPLDVALSKTEDVLQMIESGRASFGLTGTHRLSLMRQKLGIGADLAWMPLLGITDSKPSPANIEGWNLAIPAKAKNKDSAWKLLQHWTSPQIQKYQAEQAGYMPTRESVSNDPIFDTDTLSYLKTAITYAKASPLELRWPDNTDILFDALSRAFVDVLTNKMDAKAAFAAASSQYNQMAK